MDDLVRQFETELRDATQDYTKITGTNPSRFLQMLDERGCIDTARVLAHAKQAGEGFTRAWEHKCLDLTIEYMMVFGRRGEYQSLFHDEDIKAARRRLKDYGITCPVIK